MNVFALKLLRYLKAHIQYLSFGEKRSLQVFASFSQFFYILFPYLRGIKNWNKKYLSEIHLYNI